MPNGKTPQELGYETEDVTWPLVLWSLGIITGLTIVFVFGLLWLFGYRDAVPVFGQKAPVATAESRTVPSGPLLQADPPSDMDEYKEESFKFLENYGWIDEDADAIHIPIDEAMQIAIERGFPTGSYAPEPAEEPAAEEDSGEDTEEAAEESADAGEDAS